MINLHEECIYIVEKCKLKEKKIRIRQLTLSPLEKRRKIRIGALAFEQQN